MISYEIVDQGTRFYHLMGPFLVSRDVRRELGVPISSDENYRWVIAMKSGSVVGFAAVELLGDIAQLRHAYVVPECRGLGIYGDMITSREKIARRSGCRTLKAVASPNSVDALERRGYKRIKKRGKYTVMEVAL